MNDRRVVDGVRQKFTSAILPPYVRRSPRVESLLVIRLYPSYCSRTLPESRASIIPLEEPPSP